MVFSPASQAVLPTTPGAVVAAPTTSSNAVVVDTTSTSISITSQAPSDVLAPTTPSTNGAAAAAPATSSSTSDFQVTRIVLTSSTSDGTPQPKTITLTSTSSNPLTTPSATTSVTATKSSASRSSGAALATAGATSSSNSSGLSAGGKIAVAVVVPVVAVALIVLAALFLWRRRKQRKDGEELRRKEVEEYGFNPNNDPTLPVIGGASSSGDEPSEMRETDGAGYRGWGTTSTNRNPSTTLSSGQGPIGIARSTSNSENGRYVNGSPTAGTNQSSDVQSSEPLVGSPTNDRPLSEDSETIGALGTGLTKGNRQDINRGPSNASSAYSGAQRSDASGEGAVPGSAPAQQYYNDGMFYDEGMPQHGPYGDGSYGGGQPVIRDVSARRNTRIENPSVIPQQGNAGIAQNF